jgi:hypothetical protein
VAQADDAGGEAAAVTLRPGLPADAAALTRFHRTAQATALPGLRDPWREAAVAAWLRGTLLGGHAAGAPPRPGRGGRGQPG